MRERGIRCGKETKKDTSVIARFNYVKEAVQLC